MKQWRIFLADEGPLRKTLLVVFTEAGRTRWRVAFHSKLRSA